MGEGQFGCRGRGRSCPGQVFCQAFLSRVRLAAQFVLHVFRIPLEWAAKMQWFFDSLSEEGGAAICSGNSYIRTSPHRLSLMRAGRCL